MSASSRKQPTISRFFAPAKKNGDSSFTTDNDEPKKKDKTERPSSSSMKRTKSIEIDNKSPGKSPKKQKVGGNSLINEAKEKKKELGAWTKNRLQAFSLEPEPDNDENMEIDSDKMQDGDIRKTEERSNVGSNTSKSNNGIQPGELRAAPGVKLTPLEQQVVAIKKKNPDVLMFVECGYKYRFFGSDAEIAGKELNIMAHMDHSFMTASIPTHRLHVHVRRLVAKGYKVGVVKQKETAALKAAQGNKSTPFVRELSALYTRSTLIGEDVCPGGVVSGGEGGMEGDITEGATAMLMVVFEGKSLSGKEGTVSISFVAIQPSTGDIIYDTFDDNATRTELWSRLDNIQPVEALVHKSTSSHTTNTINTAATRRDDRIRIERMDDGKFEYSDALRCICELFDGDTDKIKHVSALPHGVVSCLGATVHYLKEFQLDRIMKLAGTMKEYRQNAHHMRLSGATLRNLEILNAEDGGTKGSLLWALNGTQTKFGARLLRRWIVQPLLNIEEISQRQDMIEEVLSSDSPIITNLNSVLAKLPDFERSLTTIFHKKCSPHEFWLAVSGLSLVHAQLSRDVQKIRDDIQTPSLLALFVDVVDGLSSVDIYAENISEQSAKEGKKTTLLHDFSEFPEVISKQKEIAEIEKKLNDLKPEIARVLGLHTFSYTTVSGLEYLIEVKNSQLKRIPNNWTKISSTKALCRFRSPEIEKLFQKLLQCREELQVECHEAWLGVLDSFSQHYQQHRHAVRCLATLDVILALAKLAKAQGYSKPKFLDTDNAQLNIIQGRHPIISQMKCGDEQYVSNDTEMKVDSRRVMLVTGPNMGGKSCYMRQVALIVLMAQMGSFVPAQSVEMSVFDALFTRMGASDEIFSGRSTFMVEVSETSEIMLDATRKSLVILDELGRGTSTHDGVAVAMAALDYFLNKVQCLTIFVTHYLPLTEFEKIAPTHLANFHMAFIVSEEDTKGVDVVTFLYQLTRGRAGQSYGLNVARLAHIPQQILCKAALKSQELERTCTMRRKGKKLFQSLIKKNKEEKIREHLSELKRSL